MKSYTDIEQSRKLAEILPLESADMCWIQIYDENHMMSDHRIDLIPFRFYSGIGVPCWSLAALLDILECPVLQKDKIGDEKEAWMVSCYPDGARVDSYWNESPIDACVKMIVKLKKENFTKI